MDEKSFENYLFFRIYHIDFDSALHSLKVLKRYKLNDVRYSLLRDIVVTYSRPFSANKRKNGNRHSLRLRNIVPKEMRKIHDELIRVRKQLFAHSDLPFLDPKVVNWSKDGKKSFPMSFRGYDYAKLDSRIHEIENLIQSVASNLRKAIDQIEDSLYKASKEANDYGDRARKLAPVSGPLYFTGPKP